MGRFACPPKRLRKGSFEASLPITPSPLRSLQPLRALHRTRRTDDQRGTVWAGGSLCSLIDQEVNPKFKIRPMELPRQRRELSHSRNRTPSRAIQCIIVARTIQMHRRNRSIRIDREADHRHATLVQGRLRLFRQQRDPLLVDLLKNALNVGVEVHSLGIREDLHAAPGLRSPNVAANALIAILICTLRSLHRLLHLVSRRLRNQEARP